MDLIFLKPVFKEMIWGGKRLREDFGYEITSDSTGECWAISAHPNGDCRIENGEMKGMLLSEAWVQHRELFDGMEGDRFPLLVKIIDAKDDLSIQVHPDDAYANEHENGSLGKTECWYILDCVPDATIVIGHYAKDKEDMKDMIENKRWDDFIRTIPIKKGDFFQINPGCLHAIKGGTVILETQQNSDITYRVYDYNRLSGGEPRELHVTKSIDVINAPFNPAVSQDERLQGKGYEGEKLISCSKYTVWKYQVSGKADFMQDVPFLNISIIEGEGTIDGILVKKGTNFIIPSGYGRYAMEGDFGYIASCPGMR